MNQRAGGKRHSGSNPSRSSAIKNPKTKPDPRAKCFIAFRRFWSERIHHYGKPFDSRKISSHALQETRHNLAPLFAPDVFDFIGGPAPKVASIGRGQGLPQLR